jgi:hypothetical protein
MKKIICILALTYSAGAFALPVVNENVASGGIVTIYPDHQDPHRYYVAPNIVTVAKNEDGKAIFMYTETRKNIFQKVAHIQMVLGTAYTTDDLQAAEADILKRDPKALFSGLPFIESSLEMSGELTDLIAENECVHDAGLIGQEQSCGLTLTSRGRSLFLKAVDRKALFLTLNFKYSVMGAARRADNGFSDQTITHAVAVRIDTGELIKNHAVIWR